MCGRLTLRASCKDVAELFQLSELPPLEPRYNVAPSQDVLVVRRHPAAWARDAAMLRWGLIPSWATDTSIGSRLINARSETAAEKPAFRRAFRERRCLVPADGFYSWQQQGRRKQPFFIYLKDGHLFAFAGLWESWKGGAGEVIETFTILTTIANDLVRPIHEPMPVILDPQHYDVWLDPAPGDVSVLKPLLQPYPAERMTAVRVGPLVNKPRNEGSQCAQPIAEAPAVPGREQPEGGTGKGQQRLF